jgi:predicted glycosyltransferase involved in capsule biosynthesis
MSISINVPFWSDGREQSDRIRNVIITWNELKKLKTYLIDNGLDVDIELYDFSLEKIISDSIHIPYPIGTFKKAEKLNIILNQKSKYKFFMMMDCDTFFAEEDYEKLLNVLKNLKEESVQTFDLAKLNGNISEYFEGGVFNKDKADWAYAYSGPRELGPLANGFIGGLGGVFIADTQMLIDFGGFDEKYKGWGEEDGEFMARIYNSGKRIFSNKLFSPYHLPHFADYNNPLYGNRF